VLGAWLDRARERLAALKPQLDMARAEPTMQASRSLDAWTLMIELPEPAVRMSYRLGSEGEWTDSGSSGVKDLRTGRDAPETTLSLPAQQPATTIYVKYTSVKGDQMGPFTLDFEPRAALIADQKQILERLWTSWIQFRSSDYTWDEKGRIIDFAQLVTLRCAIESAEYSFDGEQLDRRFAIPACDEARLFQLGDEPRVIAEPTGVKSVYVRLKYKDGTQSPIHEFKVPRLSESERARRLQEHETACRKQLEDGAKYWLQLRLDGSDTASGDRSLSFPMLADNRCAIARAAYSFDGDALDRSLELPACDGRELDPNSCKIPVPNGVKSVSIQLTYKDGTKSAVGRFEALPPPLRPAVRRPKGAG